MNIETSRSQYHDKRGKILTFVIGRDCSLRCAFCIVKQRGEISEKMMIPTDLVQFIHQVSDKFPVLSLSIVGYEPLMADAMPYTRAIFMTGRRLGIPFSLVTNGLELKAAAEELVSLGPTNIAVSLDSASPMIHDKIRGHTGAWARTVEGVRRALNIFEGRIDLAVASVLTPSNRGKLETMPRLLSEIGVKTWCVTLQQKINHGFNVGSVGNPPGLSGCLVELRDAAEESGVDLTIDDELSLIDLDDDLQRIGVKFRRIPEAINVIRLSASGHCAIGRDILTKAYHDAHIWTPMSGNAAEFIIRRSNACATSEDDMFWQRAS